jgi:hypothetical protein
VKNTTKELQPTLKQTQRILKNDSDEKSERTPLDLHSPLEIPGTLYHTHPNTTDYRCCWSESIYGTTRIDIIVEKGQKE